jgi:hypothetical protein
MQMNLFIRVAITPFSIYKTPFNHTEFEGWVKKVLKKGGNSTLIREPLWNKNQKKEAIDIVQNKGLIPILHNESFSEKCAIYHWSSDFIKLKPDFEAIHGISCHSLEEILIAQKQGYHYTFLSPIFFSESHPDIKPLGTEYLKNSVKRVKIPIIALGGIRNEFHIEEIKKTGAKGFASIRYFLF